jgi:hypothetical protein
LMNVCPNCGGGFVPRPIRPAVARRQGVGLSHQPPSEQRVNLSHTREEVGEFIGAVKEIPPHDR